MNGPTIPAPEDQTDSAENWLARLLSPECGPDEHAAFENWLAENPRNAVDYAEMERLHLLAGALAPNQINLVLAAVPSTIASPFPRFSARPQRDKRRWPAFAWAAVLALVVGGASWLWLHRYQTVPQHYATVVGERRTIDLPDGSQLLLDSDTSVEVAYGPSNRRVTLQRGRLQANVAHATDRPFEVESGTGSIRAVGTIFQVQRRGRDTVVSLIEGRVIVSTSAAKSAFELAALQRVTYGNDGRISPARQIDREVAEGWIRGRLVFNEDRLADLLEEINGYSRDRLMLGEQKLGDIRISGVFAANDQTALIETLHRIWGLRAMQTGEHEITLYPPEKK